MRASRTAGVLSVLLLSGLGCGRRAEKPAPAPQAAAVRPTPAVVSGPWANRPTLDDVRRAPLGEVSATYAALYRLVPDARLRGALLEVERLIIAKAPAPHMLTWEGGKWALRSGSTVVAVLPESPSYDAAIAAATNRAKALGWPLPARAAAPRPDIESLRSQIQSLDPVQIVASLRELDRGQPPGAVDPASLDLAADALVRLVLVTYDRLQMSDPLFARALACLALADLSMPRDRTREHVVLAASLGYELDARQRAERLPKTDPVRLWAEEATPRRVAAASTPADRLGSYIALLAMSSEGPESFDVFLRERFPDASPELPILAAGGRLQGLDAPGRFGSALLFQGFLLAGGTPPAAPRRREVRTTSFENFVAAVLERIVPAQDVPIGQTIGQFEASLPKACEADRGPFWDCEASQSWLRSTFYSGVHLLGLLRLDRYGHPGATKAFAESLAGVPADGPAARLKLWYEARAASISGVVTGAAEIESIAAYGSLGAQPIEDVVLELRAQVSTTQLGPAIVAAIARSLDSRPPSVSLMFRTTYWMLEDTNQIDRSCRNYLAYVRPTSWWGIWCAGWLGQRKDLRAALDSVDLASADRLAALRALRKQEAWDDAQIRRAFEAFGKSVNWDNVVTWDYLSYLEDEREDFRASERVLKLWLASHDLADEGLGYLVRQARLARAMARQGRVEQAWIAIAPLVDSWQAGVMLYASEIQALRGNVDESMRLAFACIERYPQEESIRVDVAGIAWKSGRYADATRALRPADRPVSSSPWYAAAKVFPKAMRGRSDEEVKAALAQFFPQRPDPTLLKEFADQLGPERPQLAYEIMANVAGRGSDLTYYRVVAAGWLAKVESQEEADRWLTTAIPPAARVHSASTFFEFRRHHLVWTLTDPPTGEPLPVTWLLRASTYRLDGGGVEQEERLRNFVQSAPAGDTHAGAVRYLLEKPDAFPTDLPEDPAARAVWSWAAAVDRMERGDYPAASDLLHLTSLLDVGTGGHLRACSATHIREWLDAERPLAELAAADGARKVSNGKVKRKAQRS